ncbi:MAG: hypothetical protein A3I05_07085 [Deltaproteobacteria bacterium RIFCSPLOWO2_02_FULL_44_10]|nr:MAG: hypothetical protein A3C46_00460 [Deltaproteobacteria bacterium RIFCSPHIGHO2_02_FULL_44_16]OGQ45486.1 MAG: hypothetical protein A3I05_07085 [Deltaproteobacteria bacterium RIFCSPLOWO2_02_FULL_44_10]
MYFIRLFTLSLFFLLFSFPSFAGRYDPKLQWKTITTEHFNINYPLHLQVTAEKAAGLFEEVHAKFSPELRWKPWGKTEVVLLDNTDEANGFATVLPYNWITLNVVAPRSESSLSYYDDWLRVLITHEYTHILHLDPARGIWKPFRLLFGKVVAPAGITPVWVKEGFATYEESSKSGFGRTYASLSEMIIRTSVVEGRFPGINQADGLSWEWPSYHVAYLFGSKFIQYLIHTYGEAKFLQFNHYTQHSLLLTMVNHQAKRVYGKSFLKLWKEWHATLEQKYAQEKENRGELTELSNVLTPKRHQQYKIPRLSPDGKKLVYAVFSPEHASQLHLLDLETGKTEALRKKQGAVALSWLNDGSGFIFSALASHKRYSSYYDLWEYNLTTKKVVRLTQGERAHDLALHPDGNQVLYVSGSAEKDVLKIYQRDKKEIKTLVDLSETRFSHPAWSPNGKTFVVTLHQKNELWKLFLFSAQGKQLKRLVKREGREEDAIWSADGKYLSYVSDETGIFNLYRLNVATGRVEQISNVMTGVFHPALQPNGEIIVQAYTAKGYQLKKIRFTKNRSFDQFRNSINRVTSEVLPGGSPAISGRAGTPQTAGPVTKEGFETGRYTVKDYNAFGKSLLLPRFIAPNVFYTGDTTIFSALTGGTDALRFHGWNGGVSYRLDAQHLGYFGTYVYNRYRPAVGMGVNDGVVNYGNLTFLTQDSNNNLVRRTVRYFEERRSGYGFLSFPFGRHAVSTSFFYEDRFPKTSLSAAESALLNLGIFSGFRFVYAYGDAEEYPASISLQGGRSVRFFTSITDKALGSASGNEQTIFVGDWREYLHLGRRHVLAFRGAGGMTRGDRLIQGTFSLGGALGEGSMAGGGSFFYFPLRGLPTASFSRTRAMLFSSEYRFPLTSPQRGLGTAPIFLKNLHGAFFADYGNAFNAHEGGSDKFSTFFDNFFLGVGSELRADFIVGYGLPIVGRVGYALIVLNRDRLGNLTDDTLGTSAKNGVLLLQVGTSF